jgi:hypothetical protein
MMIMIKYNATNFRIYDHGKISSVATSRLQSHVRVL